MADASYAEEQNSGDGVAVGTALTSISQGYLYNNTTFDRHRSVIGDAQAAIGIAAVTGMLYNGTNYDRPRGAASLADALANPGVGLAQGQTFLMGFNGTTWDRVRTANTGRLQVDVVTGGGGSVVDAAAWTTAVSSFAPSGGVFNDSATALTSGQQGTVRLTSDRRMYVVATGDVASGTTDAGSPVKVGGRASSTVPTAVTSGQRVNAWYSTTGVAVATIDFSSGPGDAISNGTIGQINSASATPTTLIVAESIFNGTSWDRTRSIVALDAAPNVDTGVLAVGSGPGWDRKQNPAGVAATSTANAVTIEADGADTIAISVVAIGTTPGSMIIETSADDGTTWVTAGSVLKLGAELWVSGSFVPAVGDVYLVRTTAIRRIRYRVNAVYASGTATIKWTGSTGVAIIKATDLAPQPHNIGQTVLNYQSASLGVSTSVLAIALTAGKRIYITSIRVNVGGVTAGSLALYSGAGAFTEGTSPTAFMAEFAPSATSKPGAIISFPVPWASPNTGEDIRITTVGLTASHVQIQYYVA